MASDDEMRAVGPRPESSEAERQLQGRYGTQARAAAFYEHQVLPHLNEAMMRFVEQMDLMFVATADAAGRTDSSVRAGPRGFIQVLSPHRLAYPEYRGNGVMASLANLTDNPHIGLLLIDFAESTVGLHVNGRAEIREPSDVPAGIAADARAEHWVLVSVHEAYIHCSKHLPQMTRSGKRIAWGTDDPGKKGGDFFGVSAGRRLSAGVAARAAAGSPVDPVGPPHDG